jgi:hypothetical protein
VRRSSSSSTSDSASVCAIAVASISPSIVSTHNVARPRRRWRSTNATPADSVAAASDADIRMARIIGHSNSQVRGTKRKRLAEHETLDTSVALRCV